MKKTVTEVSFGEYKESDKSVTLRNSSASIGGGQKSSSYGFYPQMKAEGIAFKREKSVAVVVGTNPGFQMGVLIVHERDRNDSRPPNSED